MFCTKCGNQIPDGSSFCPKCGHPARTAGQSQKTVEPGGQLKDISQMPNGKKKGKKVLLAVLIVTLLVAAVLGLLWGRRVIAKKQYSDQLSLGEKYLDDLDYEAAVAVYKAAIAVDPRQTDAYIGLAKAYFGLGETEKAIQVLQDGYDQTGDETLLNMADQMRTGDLETADDGGQEDARETEEVVLPEQQEPVSITVRQVDNSQFPEVSFYASVVEENGETVQNLSRDDFKIHEIDENGNILDATLNDVYQVMASGRISMNLVVDASSSMSGSNKIGKAKNAAISFVEKVDFNRGDSIEIISFNDFVYLEQDFTDDYDVLHQAISDISINGNTALLDGIYAGLMQTYYESGAKCVIAFTDGEENASSYTFDDVVNMARNTGIPVFIIGIGNSYYYSELENLANQCSGRYYSANETELEHILEDIYTQIYEEQQDYYVFRYTSPQTQQNGETRNIVVETSEQASITGTSEKEYVTAADLSGGFSNSYAARDFMIDDSQTRQLSEQDLLGKSLAELRIARNEIFARHGRQFRDIMLNQWFYSKTWYLNIAEKYSPSDFDALRPSPLSKLEIANIEYIKTYEDLIISSQDIYPHAESELLSDYDLCLSKEVLKRALAQLQGYNHTAILEQNIQMVQQAIDQDEVRY